MQPFTDWLTAPVWSGLAWHVVHCSVCPISIVPIPSSNEEIRLVDDAFGKISHMVSDGSWMVRVQAAKTLVREQDNTHSIHTVTVSQSILIDRRWKYRKDTNWTNNKECYVHTLRQFVMWMSWQLTCQSKVWIISSCNYSDLTKLHIVTFP